MLAAIRAVSVRRSWSGDASGAEALLLCRCAHSAPPNSNCSLDQLLQQTSETAHATTTIEPAVLLEAYSSGTPQERAAFLAGLSSAPFQHHAPSIDAAIAEWQRAAQRADHASAAAASIVLAAERLRSAARPTYISRVLEPLLQHERGAAALVAMRQDLLQLLHSHRRQQQQQQHQQPASVEAMQSARMQRDVRHLLALVFSGSALRLQRLSWDGSSDALRACLASASVHPAVDSNDLLRRLTGRGRCFGLFHAAYDIPLVVLQVALCDAVPSDMRSILGDASKAAADGGGILHSSGSNSSSSGSKVACFYSIKSTQPGLSGLDLGRTTILRAATALAADAEAAGGEAPQMVTLSPMPGFRAWLERLLAAVGPNGGGRELLTAQEREQLLRLAGLTSSGGTAAAQALLGHVQAAAAGQQHMAGELQPILIRLAAQYLLQSKGGGGNAALDPVANFHLNNGATLMRINFG